MLRRQGLAASIIVRADLYFMDEPTTGMDEPTTGLDPASRARAWEIAATTAAGILTTTTKSNWWSYSMALGFIASLLVYGPLMQARTPSQQPG